MHDLRKVVIDQKVQIFDDPIQYEEPFKALNWIHELLYLYNTSIDFDSMRQSFELIVTVIMRFCEYINTHKFITMKQSDL